ncbi:type II toxin-antitoxin system RelB/DinJ family antitoxin [Brucella pseudogrignonensis]
MAAAASASEVPDVAACHVLQLSDSGVSAERSDTGLPAQLSGYLKNSSSLIDDVSQMRYIRVETKGKNMTTQTTMIHVRVDEKVKKSATETLANFGLTISDAVRMLLTRIDKEGSLPVSLTTDAASYDAWFREKVNEALADTRPTISHEDYMASVKARFKKQEKAGASRPLGQ